MNNTDLNQKTKESHRLWWCYFGKTASLDGFTNHGKFIITMVSPIFMDQRTQWTCPSYLKLPESACLQTYMFFWKCNMATVSSKSGILEFGNLSLNTFLDDISLIFWFILLCWMCGFIVKEELGTTPNVDVPRGQNTWKSVKWRTLERVFFANTTW